MSKVTDHGSRLRAQPADYLAKAALLSGCSWGCHRKYVADGFASCCSSCQNIATLVSESVNDALLRASSSALSPEPAIDAEAEKALREYLWLSHGHQGVYGDDGEMQCGQCAPVWDYKRSPLADVIHRARKAREDVNMATLAALSPSSS